MENGGGGEDGGGLFQNFSWERKKLEKFGKVLPHPPHLPRILSIKVLHITVAIQCNEARASQRPAMRAMRDARGREV